MQDTSKQLEQLVVWNKQRGCYVVRIPDVHSDLAVVYEAILNTDSNVEQIVTYLEQLVDRSILTTQDIKGIRDNISRLNTDMLTSKNIDINLEPFRLANQTDMKQIKNTWFATTASVAALILAAIAIILIAVQ